MNHKLALNRGRLPWKPSRHSRTIAEFDRWDMPRTGVFAQGATLVLFDRKPIGPTGGNCAWSYRIITPLELAKLDSLDGDRFRMLVDCLVRDWDGFAFSNEDGTCRILASHVWGRSCSKV